MFTFEQYFGKFKKDATPEHISNAKALIEECEPLYNRMAAAGIVFKINPATGSIISGEQYGGYRPAACTIGAPRSAHKLGMAVDIFDADGKIDAWLLANSDLLDSFELYFEHPNHTSGWSHWSIKAPNSGSRFFIP